MFDTLTTRLGDIFDRLRRRGALSEDDVGAAMREIRVALLEADVALPVVRDFIAAVREKAVGEDVIRSVTPGQMVVKIVHDHLVQTLAGDGGTGTIDLNAPAPVGIMLVGLQGSGKTTTAAKIALRLKTRERKKVLMASLDVQRPAAQEQLAQLGKQIGVKTLPIVAGERPVAITRRALDVARREGYDVVMLDTAGRLHVNEELMLEVAAVREAGKRLLVAGVYTHFADAAEDPAFTIVQHERFLEAVEALRPVAPEALLHTSGSAAILAHPAMHHDLVRAGIAFYGYPPVPGPASLRPAMSVFCRVAQVRTVARGESVGYGRTWRAATDRRIATATIGYGQGLPRALSNRGHLGIRGARCAIVGIVSMDQVGVDVSDVDGVVAGDAAMFIGSRDGIRIGADEVGGLTGTLPHEILCGISEGIPRHPGAAPAALP